MPIKFPAATFMVNLASDYMKMYPEHVIGQLTQEEANCCPENMLGSGPWMFKEGSWEKQQSYEFERNPNYFKGPRPYFDGFKVHIIADTSRGMATLKVGQADGTYFPVLSIFTDFVEQLEEDTDGRMRALFMPNVQRVGLRFNWKREPYDDPRVRRALWLAIDKEEVIQKVLRGNGSIGTHFNVGFAPNETVEALYQLPGYRRDADGSQAQADIVEAQRLMAEAGYPNGFKDELITNTIGCSPPTAQLVSQQWREHLNVDMTLSQYDTATLYVYYRDVDFGVLAPCGTGIILPDPSDILNQWYGKDTMRNALNWTTPEFEALKEASVRELDPEKRRLIVAEMVGCAAG